MGEILTMVKTNWDKYYLESVKIELADFNIKSISLRRKAGINLVHPSIIS